jgi:hypothetical protein
MLRFIPDDWLEALLRPLLMADSVAGLYTEIHAPDWRFAALALLLPLGWLPPRKHQSLQPQQVRLLVGLLACFYVWTLVSGNGRYFLPGLLLVGPLVVLAARRLPATQSMRNTVILLVLAVQGTAAWMTFKPNVWGLRPWFDGRGLPLQASALQQRPAVFLTITGISFSILAPTMHPASRWANITGQQDLVPGMLEYERLQELLSSPLPKYIILQASPKVVGPDGETMPQARVVLERLIARQGLTLGAGRCEFLQSTLAALPIRTSPADETSKNGFLFCPVERQGFPSQMVAQPPVAPEMDEVFEQVERRCPRFFPAGNARNRVAENGSVVRHYSESDTSLIIQSGQVLFKNFRAFDPTLLASAEQVRRGNFTIDCQRLPGRYLPPWKRD